MSILNIIKNFFIDLKTNYKTLILAFVLAAGFWIVVSIQVFPTIEQRINGVAIEAQLTDYMVQNNLQIIGALDSNVNVRIEGKRYEISALKSDDFYATLNLSSIRSAGTYTVPITVSSKTDTEFNILETNPIAVTIVIDEIATREFPVNGTAPNISLSEEYYLDTITASPSVVTITGSASVLDKITRIEARSAFHGEIYDSQETGSDIIIYGANGAQISSDNLELSSNNISVNIPVYKKKELELVFTITNYPANFDISSLKYTIQPKTITVASPDDSIDYQSEIDIGTIDISDLSLTPTSIIPITLPEGYKNLSGNNNARIVWEIDDYGKLDFTTSNINVTNAPDNYDVSLITNELTFTVIGPSKSISALTSNSFIVTANLLGTSLHEGSQDVEVVITMKGTNQKCWITGDYRVTVQVQEKTESNPEE